MNKIYKEYLQNGVIDEDNAVDIIEEQGKEIERLNYLLEDIKKHLESYDYDNMPLDARVLARNVSLIINGTIKVVREEEIEKQ